jgi:hypothetical protein
MKTQSQMNWHMAASKKLTVYLAVGIGVFFCANAALAISVLPTPTVTLTGNDRFIVEGSAETFTAVVAGTGSIVPTGNVVFKCGAATLGSAALDSSGTATLTTSNFGIGGHGIVAMYGGDIVYGPANSKVYDIRDDGTTAPTVKLTPMSSDSIPHNGGVRLRVKVTGGMGTATGDVYFYDSMTPYDTIEIPLNDYGYADYDYVGFLDGEHHFTAVYSGNDTYATETSSALVVTVGGSTSSTAVEQ